MWLFSQACGDLILRKKLIESHFFQPSADNLAVTTLVMGQGVEKKKVDSATLLGVCNQREARLKPVLFIAARTRQHSLCHHLASSHFALSIQTCSAAVTQQPHMLPATTVTLYKPHKATHYLYQQYFLYKYAVQFFFFFHI